jgi:8-oxo-dGTP pyrophosphatase MutT (NUDIX family)
MSVTPEITVAAIVERDAEFLIVEEHSRGGLVLNQPAGHLEPGETLVEAVIRETREETGWEFVPKAVCGVHLWRRAVGETAVLRFNFCGDVVRWHEGPLDHGIERAVWMTRTQLVTQAARLRTDMVLLGIDDFRSGRRYPLHLVQHFTESRNKARRRA